MADIIKEITLDLLRPTQYVYLRLQQGTTNGIKVNVTIIENDEEYIIPTFGVTTVLRMVNPVGVPIFNTCSVINNKVQFTVTEAMTSVNGKCEAKIQLYNSTTGADIRTLKFNVLIDKDVYTDDIIISTGEYTALQDAMLKCANLETTYTPRLTTVENEIATARGTASSLDGRFDQVDSQLVQNTNDVSSFGAKGDGITDDTIAIQKALDKGGVVTVRKAGIYIVKGLAIGSNTSLILSDGVNFVLKAGTHDYMIRNKGDIATPKYRDKNITISGGIYNFDSVNNSATGSPLDGLYAGFGMLFNKVDELRIENIVQIGNASSYAISINDATNVVCENGYIDNNSDGIHFQPPLSNIRVSNWTGITNDNFISFTGGDYRIETVSEDGNANNILVENIYINDATRYCHAPICIVGAGKSGLGYWDNIEIKNVVAKVVEDGFMVTLIYSDQSVPNDYLNNTIIKNIKISGLKRLNASSQSMISSSAFVQSLAISDIEIDPSIDAYLLTSNWIIKNLTIKNVHTLTGTQVTINTPIINLGVAGTAWMISNLSIVNCYFEINSTNDFSLIQAINDAFETLNIDNSMINFTNSKGFMLNLSGNVTQSNIKISNSKLTGIKNTIQSSIAMRINACDISCVDNILADLNSLGKLRVIVAASDFSFKVANLISPATLSYNGTSAIYNGLLTDLTPISGDIFNIIYGEYSGVYEKISSNIYQYNKTIVS